MAEKKRFRKEDMETRKGMTKESQGRQGTGRSQFQVSGLVPKKKRFGEEDMETRKGDDERKPRQTGHWKKPISGLSPRRRG